MKNTYLHFLSFCLFTVYSMSSLATDGRYLFWLIKKKNFIGSLFPLDVRSVNVKNTYLPHLVLPVGVKEREGEEGKIGDKYIDFIAFYFLFCI